MTPAQSSDLLFGTQQQQRWQCSKPTCTHCDKSPVVSPSQSSIFVLITILEKDKKRKGMEIEKRISMQS
jgi:hypothetical protein